MEFLYGLLLAGGIFSHSTALSSDTAPMATPEPIRIDIPTTTPETRAISQNKGQEIAPKADKMAEIAKSCILTARYYGLKIPYPSDAKDLKPNSPPVIGGGILFYYPSTDTWHVSVIQSFTKDGSGMNVIEGNFQPNKISKRVVRFDDKFIRGFLYY